jgi:hypothetical protein
MRKTPAALLINIQVYSVTRKNRNLAWSLPPYANCASKHWAASLFIHSPLLVHVTAVIACKKENNTSKIDPPIEDSRSDQITSNT